MEGAGGHTLLSKNSHSICQVTYITIQCSYKAIMNQIQTTKHVMLTLTDNERLKSHMTWRPPHGEQ